MVAVLKDQTAFTVPAAITRKLKHCMQSQRAVVAMGCVICAALMLAPQVGAWASADETADIYAIATDAAAAQDAAGQAAQGMVDDEGMQASDEGMDSVQAEDKAAAHRRSIPEKRKSAAAEGLIDRVLTHFGPARRLSDEDAARYAHIFAFQDVGDFAKADIEIAKLKDDRLKGHVLYQRYMSADYKVSYDELARWMKKYADLPNAQQVYALAQRRKPKGATAALTPPQVTRGVLGQHDFDVGQLGKPYLAAQKIAGRKRDIVTTVRANLSDRPSVAVKKLDSKEGRKLFTPAEYDAVQGEIAESYFYNGKASRALTLAAASVNRSGADVPRAAWIAGLAAWRAGDYPRAAGFFEKAATSPRASVWMSSAAAHWAARCYLRAHQPDQVSKWLYKAAEHPRTFYGLISMKMLGMDPENFNWDMPAFSDRDARILSATPQGRRAIALVDAERPDLAELELSRLNPGSDEDLQEAMIALADKAHMPWMAMRMGSTFRNGDSGLYDAALYPEVPWTPDEGFAVDKALVYAVIRQESRFNPNARNKSSGAVGLMQLMPTTAQHIAGKAGVDLGEDKLQDPIINIDLGQKYLAELLSTQGVDNNLFKLAVAYNAGPGKLARWSENASFENDPLYFIEAIPAAETRMFVERVLTNYWIYRLKFDQDTDSLDRVATGQWPTYIAQEGGGLTRLASAMGLINR